MEAEYGQLFLSNFQPAHLPQEHSRSNCEGDVEQVHQPAEVAEHTLPDVEHVQQPFEAGELAPSVDSTVSDALRVAVTAFGTPAHQFPSELENVPMTPKTPKGQPPPKVQWYDESGERFKQVAPRNVLPLTLGPMFEFHRGVFPMESKHAVVLQRLPPAPAQAQRTEAEQRIEAEHQRLVGGPSKDIEEDRRVWNEVKQPNMHEAPSPPPELNAPADTAAGPDCSGSSMALGSAVLQHEDSVGDINVDQHHCGTHAKPSSSNPHVRLDQFLEDERWFESVSDAMRSCTSCSTARRVKTFMPALLHFTVRVPLGAVGLQYRRSKSLYDMLPRMARNGTVVSGIMEPGNEGTWLHVEAGAFLPLTIGDVQVLHAFSSWPGDIAGVSGLCVVESYPCLATDAVDVMTSQTLSDDGCRDGRRAASLDSSTPHSVAVVAATVTKLPARDVDGVGEAISGAHGATKSMTTNRARGAAVATQAEESQEQAEFNAVMFAEEEDELPEPRSEVAKAPPLSLQRPLQRASSQATTLAAAPLLSVNKRLGLPARTDTASRSTAPVFLGIEGLSTKQPVPTSQEQQHQQQQQHVGVYP